MNGKRQLRFSVLPKPVLPFAHRTRSTEYFEVQKGIPLVVTLVLSSLLTLAWMWLAGPHLFLTLVLLPQLFCMVCFCTLRIHVARGLLSWQYGPGWIRGCLPLAHIEKVEVVMTPFAYGWGFRRTLHGWRFHRLGTLAVELRSKDGKIRRLGTSHALELQQALTNHEGQ